jgi:hypothetical protein
MILQRSPFSSTCGWRVWTAATAVAAFVHALAERVNAPGSAPPEAGMRYDALPLIGPVLGVRDITGGYACCHSSESRPDAQRERS